MALKHWTIVSLHKVTVKSPENRKLYVSKLIYEWSKEDFQNRANESNQWQLNTPNERKKTLLVD